LQGLKKIGNGKVELVAIVNCRDIRIYYSLMTKL